MHLKIDNPTFIINKLSFKCPVFHTASYQAFTVKDVHVVLRVPGTIVVATFLWTLI